jgi:multiple sugar transport system permease protein
MTSASLDRRTRSEQRAALPAALRKRRRREGLTALGFMSPWLIGFAVFFAYPLLAAAYFSFYYYDQFNPPTWVGLKNWNYILTQYPDLVTGLKNTLWLVVVMVTLQTVFALGVSLLITKIKRGGNFFRTMFYLPYLAPPVISTLIFVYMFDYGGPVDSILAHLGVHNPPLWFNDPNWFKPSLTLLSLWGVGNTMVIFFAALLDVPKEQLEAAQLDGAGPLKRFRFVTLPTISPVILFSVITGVIYTMQYYTQALVAGQVASGTMASPGTQLTLGYPLGSSLTVPQLIYETGIVNTDTGPACVLSIILFAMTMLFTLVLLRRKSGFMGGD